MQWQFTTYSLPLIVGIFALALTIVYAWQHRTVRGARWMVGLGFMLILYVGGYALELSSMTPQAALFALKVEYTGLMSSIVWLLMLTASFLGLPWAFRWRSVVLLSVIPAITVLVAWTHGLHDLLWQQFRLIEFPHLYIIDFVAGPWYWFNTVYIWTVVLCGGALLLRAYHHETGLFRQQLQIFIAGYFFPAAAALIYLSGILGLRIDPVPYALTITAIIVAYGMFSRRFLDIMPVARQTVFETLSDAVIVISPAGQVVDINPAARALLTVPADTAIYARALADVFPPELNAVLAGGNPVQTEITLGERIYDLRTGPVMGPVESLEGRLLVLRDITGRKQIETEREMLIDELEAFAHTVAHDLKSPLMTIVGYSSLLRLDLESVSQERLDADLAQIEATGVKMSSIVDALLLLAETGAKQTGPLESLDMPTILGGVQLRLGQALKARDATLVVPTSWPDALGYAPWVEEVWANYISNAIKYGGSPPQITLGAQVMDGEAVRFTVSDNGVGLTPMQQTRLFTRFSRLHTDRAEGHGLGLSIVQRIVERMGGSVGVESTPGEGSTFYFTLPRASVAPYTATELHETNQSR